MKPLQSALLAEYTQTTALNELKERNLLPTHDRVLEYVPVQELDIPSIPERDIQLKELDQLLGGILHD